MSIRNKIFYKLLMKIETDKAKKIYILEKI